MFGLNAIRTALATLAANITGLAATVKDIDVHLRQRATLDGPEPADATAPALTIDGKASGIAQDATGGPPVDSPDPAPAVATRNGRRKPVAVSAE